MQELLASVLQAWALFCLHEGINFRVAHLAGERNHGLMPCLGGRISILNFGPKCVMDSGVG